LHNTEQDAYIIVDNIVFDVTKFISAHPGGREVLLPYFGKDATEVFYSLHRSDVVRKYQKSLQVGTVDNGKKFIVQDEKIRKTPYGENSYLLGLHTP